ncbi:hypothetical protein FGG51_gp012 [Mycobacterium phage Astro]|uniref:Uncharacterized protein n=2 Tax=Fromanvirus astro TaxID=1195075 RepID=I6S7E5_9CAUD|nr:hypothetical protein AVT31_gp012 [Mycobacterium phage Smeadley]YP_009638552.1 hypothetical protein FGG51_gp012 [Mycobacterium phage Astro]QBI96687.1 hypothetical protein SEA_EXPELLIARMUS_92 [Mycobacterium phage Expelliarmus]WNO26778.1 hypothetical protein SEA_GROUNDHOG_92 [Mycobacterium phage Groundhog]AFM54980.1 hypothetical protein ASTRO_94 [Mycobacterium phage Astro]AKQ07663.1 hypothetical protein SEA_SMEADLEY_95 [Mycobacterium phage Smeadley]
MTATLAAPVEGTATQNALLEMWTENTGRHLLDSGGAYGRRWERNQGLTVADMMATPQVTMDLTFGEMLIYVSAWHWLEDMLEFDPYMQRVFERYANLEGLKDEPWLECAERFAQAAHDSSWSRDEVRSYNTYNGESWLNETLQYVTFTDRRGIAYVAMQYHGGCDVRGGYTKPRIFQINDSEGHYALYDEGHVSLHCTEHHGQDLGEGLWGPVRDTVHAWDSNSSGIEWCTYGGSFDNPEFEVIEPEEGDNYVACPTCKAPMEISVFFGH